MLDFQRLMLWIAVCWQIFWGRSVDHIPTRNLALIHYKALMLTQRTRTPSCLLDWLLKIDLDWLQKETARPRFKREQPNSKRKFFWGMFFKFIFKAPDIPMWIVLLFSHLLFLGEDLSALLWDESKGCLRHRLTSSRCARIYRWAWLRLKSLHWPKNLLMSSVPD